jgi:hypothetical protein
MAPVDHQQPGKAFRANSHTQQVLPQRGTGFAGRDQLPRAAITSEPIRALPRPRRRANGLTMRSESTVSVPRPPVRAHQ